MNRKHKLFGFVSDSILFCLIASILTFPSVSAGRYLDMNTTVYAEDWTYGWFEGKAGDFIWCNLTVLSGGNVDLFLLSTTFFDEWKDMKNGIREDFHYYIEGSYMDVGTMSDTYYLASSGVFYVVVDNSIEPEGGAIPSGTVSFTLTLERASAPSPFGTSILIAGIIGGVVSVVILILVLLLIRKQKAKAPPPYAPTAVKRGLPPGPLVTCRKCGSLVAASDNFCEKCGARL